MIHIRNATNADQSSIRAIHLQAFSAEENQRVALLAIDLLHEQTSPETFAFVAELDGAVVGHIALSPVAVSADPDWQGYILSPLGVLPEHQKRGIGSKLIEHGIAQLEHIGTDAIFVYGDPAYYGKFGFRADAALRYAPPYPLQYPFGWQAIMLNERDTGQSPLTILCVVALCDPELW
ncbi:MAG: N-acetyltransferase [Herpetosiphon sp.]|nr:N-acetyltransferase [Herpetosiphon sp.]